MDDRLGGTLGAGYILYGGGIDELNKKCRKRDDEIDRLRKVALTASLLVADVHLRHPGEELKCPLMKALSDAVIEYGNSPVV
jgi:hypothetical protein